MLSKRFDDAGILQCIEIDQRDEDQRVGILLLYTVIQIAVQLDHQRFSATSTFREYGDCQRVFLELPLHEGYRYCVNPSSCKGLFTAIEIRSVGGRVDRHRICPSDTFWTTAIQKCHTLL